jgi:hypothetical protein
LDVVWNIVHALVWWTDTFLPLIIRCSVELKCTFIPVVLSLVVQARWHLSFQVRPKLSELCSPL